MRDDAQYVSFATSPSGSSAPMLHPERVPKDYNSGRKRAYSPPQGHHERQNKIRLGNRRGGLSFLESDRCLRFDTGRKRSRASLLPKGTGCANGLRKSGLRVHKLKADSGFDPAE